MVIKGYCFFIYVKLLDRFCPNILQSTLENYSSLSASIGFAAAALKLCQLTVSSAIAKAVKPAKAKTHQLKVVL